MYSIRKKERDIIRERERKERIKERRKERK
jgi:hypothetical protein